MGQAIEEGSLTGRRRFVHDEDGYNVLSLQVEVNVWIEGDKDPTKGRWGTKWRYAKPDDITSEETVIDLSRS